VKLTWGSVAALAIIVTSLFVTHWAISYQLELANAESAATAFARHNGVQWPLKYRAKEVDGAHCFFFVGPPDKRSAEVQVRRNASGELEARFYDTARFHAD